MGRVVRSGVLAGCVLATVCWDLPVFAADESLEQGIILVEEDAASKAIDLEDEDAEPEGIVTEAGDGDAPEQYEILIENEANDNSGSSDAVVVEGKPGDSNAIELEEESGNAETTVNLGESAPAPAPKPAAAADRAGGARLAGFALRADKLRLEYSPLVGSDESVDALGYGNAELSVAWAGSAHWEARLAGRVDAYLQDGDPQFDQIEADYGESFLRWRSDTLRMTLGTQTVIWGRIDELPPTDRLSVQDFTRFILDDLQDRRRARPMLRLESFGDRNKLDVLWLPTFREAELPEKDSIWYPIDRRRGEILGLEGSAILRQVVKSARIDDDAPDSDSGFGLRFSRSEGAVDFALTAQQGRQSAPYFEYDLPTNTFEARYPSAWSLGGDIGIEAGSVLWRFEAVWISELPVTRENFEYDTVEGVNWAAGIEFYPGDGDARVNLQFAATNFKDTTDVLDRTGIYNFNGSMELPFAQDLWRAKMRFFAGLDERDVYINPEIVFMGWQPHSLYVELQYFAGADGTMGGFHEEHSLVAVGWRAEF